MTFYAAAFMFLSCAESSDNVKINALPPEITRCNFTEGEAKIYYLKVKVEYPIAVSAESKDGGSLYYQWFQTNEEYSPEGSPISGRAIEGGGTLASEYYPPAKEPGTFYYYCVVTNVIEQNADGGIKEASVASPIAKVEIIQKGNAAEPVIGDMEDVSYGGNEEPPPLVPNISFSEGEIGEISYQWYFKTGTGAGGQFIEIAGAVQPELTPSIEFGTGWRYIVATNTLEEAGDGGRKKASAQGSPVKVAFTAP